MSNSILVDSMSECISFLDMRPYFACLTPFSIIMVFGVVGILLLVLHFIIPKFSKPTEEILMENKKNIYTTERG